MRGCDRPYAHRPRTDFNRELIARHRQHRFRVIGGLRSPE
ncbi:hypothetical protein I552_6868 [Mycobacterium xenopi 3993]|nr:hypothetical protein I552_6868 [Mycobacterium xenopi 3993]